MWYVGAGESDFSDSRQNRKLALEIFVPFDYFAPFIVPVWTYPLASPSIQFVQYHLFGCLFVHSKQYQQKQQEWKTENP